MTRPGPGKFEGNPSLEISEALYAIVGNGGHDDEIGDVQSFGWHALITEFDPYDEDGNFLWDAKPAYIVLEDSNGFFSYQEFDLNTLARRAWKDITQEFLALMDDTEGVSVL